MSAEVFPMIVTCLRLYTLDLEAKSTDPQCEGLLVSISVNTVSFLLAPFQVQAAVTRGARPPTVHFDALMVLCWE